MEAEKERKADQGKKWNRAEGAEGEEMREQKTGERVNILLSRSTARPLSPVYSKFYSYICVQNISPGKREDGAATGENEMCSRERRRCTREGI